MSSEIPGIFLTDTVADSLYLDPHATAVVKDPHRLILISGEGSSFLRVTSNHGRSFVDDMGYVLRQQDLTDEHGDTYRALSIKGPDFSCPEVSLREIEPNEVRVSGAQDAAIFQRCKLASALLRREGVLCEWPFYFAQPKNYPRITSEGIESVGLSAYRKSLYDDYISSTQASMQPLTTAYRIGNGLSEMRFGVSYRATLSHFRIADVGLLKVIRETDFIIADAIHALQKRKPQHLHCWKEIETLDPNNTDDQAKYMQEVLPGLMGENLARLHVSGVQHKYLHDGNWTIAGEIVDLDSVNGPGLYKDETLTESERIDDIFESIKVVESLGEGAKQHFLKGYYTERVLHATHFEAVLLESYLITFDFDTKKMDLTEKDYPSLIDLRNDEHSAIVDKAFPVFVEVLEKMDTSAQDPTQPTEKSPLNMFVDIMHDDILAFVQDYVAQEQIDLGRNSKGLIGTVTFWEVTLLYDKVQHLITTNLANRQGDFISIDLSS